MIKLWSISTADTNLNPLPQRFFAPNNFQSGLQTTNKVQSRRLLHKILLCWPPNIFDHWPPLQWFFTWLKMPDLPSRPIVKRWLYREPVHSTWCFKKQKMQQSQKRITYFNPLNHIYNFTLNHWFGDKKNNKT